VTWKEAETEVAAVLGDGVIQAMREPELSEIETLVRNAASQIPQSAELPRVHDASFTLARLCYAVVRATRPQVVVETGVGFGVTSTFLLRALARNGMGELHSIDRPAPVVGAPRWVGYLVPEDLRGRWKFHEGASLDVLPRLLKTLGPVDMFLHDSRHTYRNILGELRLVEPRLSSRAVVMADDIERNVAFERWLVGRSVRLGRVLREEGKPGLLGICLL
jgi:predicted O-methyltransferase YrrM